MKMRKKIFNALTAAILFAMPSISFGQAPTLGVAANFVLFTTIGPVTNSGIPYLTHLTGNVGTNTGSSTGFGNVDGQMHDGGPTSVACAADVTLLYGQLDAATPTFSPMSPLLGSGQILVAGVYQFPLLTAASLNLNLILDGEGDPNALFIIKIDGAFSTSANAKVQLVNGALACNVFWLIEGMVDMGAGTTMRGTILAHNAAINMGALDTLEGRALSISGAITTNSLMAYTPIGCGSPFLTGPAAPALVSTASFGVFSSLGPVTSTPVTYIMGDVGSATAGPTGFDPLNVSGDIYGPGAVTATCAADLLDVYNYMNALSTDIELLHPDLFGYDLVLTPHTYHMAAAPISLTGSIYLNAQGNPNAVFVINMNGAFITTPLSKIILMNGAQAKNVYWKIDGAVHIYPNSLFNGTIVAAGAIDVDAGDTLNGRAMTINGAVAINGSYVTTTPAPCVASAITGIDSVCVGLTTLLSSSDTGRTWHSSNTSVATIDTFTGLVSGVTSGTTVITLLTGLACESTDTITVNPMPLPITSTDSVVCVGATITYTTLSTGGTWTSSDVLIATVGSASGIITGVAASTATITYTNSSECSATKRVTVNPLPDAGLITGTTTVCNGSTTTLSNAAGSGIWSSVTPATATIGSATGIVTGMAAGTTIVSYTVTNSCGTAVATTIVTVNPLPDAGAITGTLSTCPTGTTTLSNAAGSGIWSSVTPATATIGSMTGIVTGIAAGTTTISYTVTNSCGTAAATAVATVNATTDAGVITGVTTVCNGRTTTLSNAAGSGIWSSVTPATATIGSISGIVTGIAAGTTTISYTVTNSCGTAAATAVVTVNATTDAGVITGVTTVCNGNTTTLGNTAGSGVWSSVTPATATIGSATGIVTAMAVGTTTISYTVTNSCGTATVTTIVTVNPLPDAGAITGTLSTCPSGTTTLSNAAGSGIWSSVTPATATIGSMTGIVTGIAAGTTTISYTVTNSCGTAAATVVVTVNLLPDAGVITGTTTICNTATTTLADAAGTGTWSSVTPATATIGLSSGVVTGMSAGTTTISYTVTNSCGTAAATVVVTVNPLPDAGFITGTSAVCLGATTTLTNIVSGGVWTSLTTATATIGSLSGIVTGMATGTSIVSYAVTNGCGTAAVTVVVTVNPLPDAGALAGTTTLCAGTSATLSSTTTGGVWTSVTTATATIGSLTGVVTALSAGTTSISYTVTNSCGTDVSSLVVSVNPAPNAGTILGVASVCPGNIITLTATGGSGVWNSSTTSVATIDVTTGVVAGVAAGTTVVSYSVTNGCGTDVATRVVTVNPLPNAGVISGPSGVCVGGVINLTNTVSGGTWSITNANATMTAGMVIGVAPGLDTVVYAVSNFCGSATAIKIFTVNPLPAVTIIATQSPSNVCVGTMYQNFGAAIPSTASTVYEWSAVNAAVWAQGAGHNYSLINFNGVGTAYVTLTTVVPATGCISQNTVAITVNATPAQVDYVSYFSGHFVCTPNDRDSYQWGYDNKYTLDSTILTGEINQDYVNVSPDFTGKYFWVITNSGGCQQKTYYRAPLVVTQVKDAALVKVFPNPATNLLHVELSGVPQGNITIEVWNMTGQKVAQVATTDNAAIVNVADLAAGTYILTCYVDGVKIISSRFAKN
jgi:hypothetical protein